MKKFISITLATVISATLLTGCGSDDPEDVTVDFVSALSKADIKEAKRLSTNPGYSFQSLAESCNATKAMKLQKETNELMRKLKSLKKTDQEGTDQINLAMKTYDKKIEEIRAADQKAGRKFLSEYGSNKNIPKDILKPYVKTYREKFFTLAKELVAEQFRIAGVKTNEDTLNIASQMKANKTMGRKSYMPVEDAIDEVLKRSPAKITAECVDKNTGYGYIKDMNIIEVKTLRPDKVEVRVELIDKDDKSLKVKIELEKIKEEWKVFSF